jgi:hypothetical protein
MVFGHTDGGTARIPASFPDGTSNTLMFTERHQMCHGTPNGWGYSSLYYWTPMFAFYSKGKFQNVPSDAECDPALAQSSSAAGIQVALGDGSARTVSDRISPQTWYFVCDPADGNVIGPDWND